MVESKAELKTWLIAALGCAAAFSTYKVLQTSKKFDEQQA
jgi:hypothetical protein